jgi:hypothetical protein
MAITAQQFWKNMKDTFGPSNGAQAPSAERILERILNPYEDVAYRVPFIFTSDHRTRNGIDPVKMKMNPETVTFTQNKRITRRDTQSGAVFFHWTNAKGRNNDVINIAFSGSTGNINLRTGMQRNSAASEQIKKLRDYIKSKTQQEGLDVENLAGASKLVNFWNLYSLTREPVLDPFSGIPNKSYFMYTSPILGNAMVTFIGYFDRVLEFTDDASNPFSKNYSFSFVATETMPSMDDIFRYISLALGRDFFNELE